MSSMFAGAGVVFNQDNYDALLIGWSTIDDDETELQSEIPVPFHAGDALYCAGTAARGVLTGSPYSWVITDGGRVADADCSSDATLSGLSIGPGSLIPSFDPAITDYTTTVSDSAVDALTVTPTTTDAIRAAITVNEQPVTSGDSTEVSVNPSSGEVDVTITVMAQDGTVRTYTITAEENIGPSFDGVTIDPQIYAEGRELNTILPKAVGGNGALTYTVAARTGGPERPDWFMLNPVTRRVTGTPTALSTMSFLYRVIDAEGDSNDLRFTVTVETVNKIPTFDIQTTIDPNTKNLGVGRPFTFTLPPVDSEGNGTLSYIITGAVASTEVPDWLSFDPVTRTATGTPETALAPTEFTYRATDADGETAELQFAIRVFGQLVVKPSKDRTFTQGREIIPFELPASTSSGSGNVSYSVIGLPVGLVFSEPELTISGTPTDSPRVYPVGYIISDAVAMDLVDGIKTQFNITIEEDTPPSFDMVSIQDQIYSVGLTIAMAELPAAIDGNRVEYTVGALPEGDPPPDWFIFDAVARTITGTPDMALEPTGFLYTATDSEGQTDSTIFTVAVYTPLLVGDISDVGLTAGRQITPFRLPEATGGSGNYNYSVSTLPDGLTFADDTQTISGTPEVAAAGTTVEVTYSVTDGVDANPVLEPAVQTFRITVAGDSGNNTNDFVTTWRTARPNETITIPTAGSGYDYAVDWGDNSTPTINTGNARPQVRRCRRL